ncbi:MAG: hypothetical protein V5A84_01335, partial [Planctomycetota bacterium]
MSRHDNTRSAPWLAAASCVILALTLAAPAKGGSGEGGGTADVSAEVKRMAHPPDSRRNSHYAGNRPPLTAQPMTPLPLDAVRPKGWLKKKLQMEAEGYTGRLEEISLFLREENNAWRSPKGKGIHGWEEVPYWLRGYVPLAYLLEDEEMIENARDWLEPII